MLHLRRYILISITVLFLTGLVGCSTGSSQMNKSSGEKQEVQAAPTEIFQNSIPENVSSSKSLLFEEVIFRGNLQRTGVCQAEGVEQKPALAWKFKTGDIIYSSPVIANGTLFFGSKDGNFYALDSANGKEKWRSVAGNAVRSSAAVVNGIVYFGSHDNNLYALDAETGKKIWHFPTKGGVESSPAIDNGVAYFGSFDNSLYAVDIKTGKEK